MRSRIPRLREWHRLGKIQKVFEDPAATAGREAEQFALELVDTHVRYKNASCYLGKRLPSKEHGRRFEIDLVVLTPNRIYLFEIKNWSGELKASGADWIQIRRNGEMVQGPNLVDYNQTKVNVVRNFLRSQGIELDRSYFSNRVIFMNPRLQVDPVIVSHPHVITRDRLEGYLSAQRGNTLAERFARSIIETCLDTETGKALNDRLFHAMPSGDFQAVQDLFATVRTWDKVGLHGGKVLTGDVLKLTLGGRALNITDFAPGTLLRLSWTRNRIWGLIKALVTSFPLGRLRYPGVKTKVRADDQIQFHHAGEETPTEFALGCVNWIIKG
ncbi:MAG: nuclease-related domain-containing protein [bacterium]